MQDKQKLTKAAALKYDPSKDQAPIVVAAGQGVTAQNSVKTAAKNDVPIVEDSNLSELLTSLSVGDAIPRPLYEAVAQILIFVSQQDENFLKRLRF